MGRKWWRERESDEGVEGRREEVEQEGRDARRKAMKIMLGVGMEEEEGRIEKEKKREMSNINK